MKGVKLFRYKCVDAVRVPWHMLAEFRLYNKDKCESDKLMPQCSESMCLANLTKTHFTHGCKLVHDGARTAFNEGKVKLSFKADCVEGCKILDTGVLTCIYSDKLLLDEEALFAVMSADNENADLEMEEDELQAQGRVEMALKSSGQSRPITVCAVLDVMRKQGLRAFSEENTKHLVTFRLSLSPAVAQCYRTCVWHVAAGIVRVRPHDYGVVSHLDPRVQWVRASVLIAQYMFAYKDRCCAAPTRTGRAVAFARNLNANWLKQLATEGTTLLELESAVVKILKHYVLDNASLDTVLLARTLFLFLDSRGTHQVNKTNSIN